MFIRDQNQCQKGLPNFFLNQAVQIRIRIASADQGNPNQSGPASGTLYHMLHVAEVSMEETDPQTLEGDHDEDPNYRPPPQKSIGRHQTLYSHE